MIEIVIVAAFVTFSNVVWAYIGWRVFMRLQTQNGKLLEGILVLSTAPPVEQATQAANLASQMEATDRAQVEGDQLAAQRRSPLRAAT